MTKPASETDHDEELPDFDVSIAHPARMYNYLLGGKDNFAADRAAGDRLISGGAKVHVGVRANRAFLRRAVSFLAADAGVRQFLDIGTGLPSADNTHEVAQRIAPETRVVYADNDPIVLAHARVLLVGRTGPTAYVNADLRDTGKILEAAAKTLDFTKPVALMLLFVLQYIPDEENPRQIVARLLDALPSGSYLAVSDAARDLSADANVVASANRLNERMGSTQTEPSHPGGDRALLRRAGNDGAWPGTAAPVAARPGSRRPRAWHINIGVLRHRP